MRITPSTRTAGIVGLGTALPERSVSSAEIGARVGVSAEWIERRTGIRERRHAAATDRVSDLAASAGAAALEDAGLKAGELDMVLVATVASDEITPAAAPIVAHELGAVHAAAIDVGAACTGSLAGLAHASAWIETGRGTARARDRRGDPRRASSTSRIAARHRCSATAPARSSSRADGDGEIGPFVFGSDGSRATTIQATRASGVLEMEGHETFLQAVQRLSASTLEVLDIAGLDAR